VTSELPTKPPVARRKNAKISLEYEYTKNAVANSIDPSFFTTSDWDKLLKIHPHG